MVWAFRCFRSSACRFESVNTQVEDWIPRLRLCGVHRAATVDFVTYVNELLPEFPDTETALFARFAAIGVMSDVSLTAEQKAEVQAGIDAAYAAIKQEVANLQIGNGYIGATTLFGTREFLNGNYMGRAVGADFGLWGNSKEEANYFMSFVEGEGDIVFCARGFAATIRDWFLLNDHSRRKSPRETQRIRRVRPDHG